MTSERYLVDNPPGDGGQPVVTPPPLLQTGGGRRGRGEEHQQEHPGHAEHAPQGEAGGEAEQAGHGHGQVSEGGDLCNIGNIGIVTLRLVRPR